MTPAGLKALPLPEPHAWAYPTGGYLAHHREHITTDMMLRNGWVPLYAPDAIAAAVAAERERCAMVCEALRDQWRPEYGPYDSGRLTGLENAAAAIREGKL